MSGNGLCLEGVMYGGGFVQGGFVRRVFCPRTIYSTMYSTMYSTVCTSMLTEARLILSVVPVLQVQTFEDGKTKLFIILHNVS